VDEESDYPMHCPYSTTQETEWIVVRQGSVASMSEIAQIQGSTWEGRCPNCQGKGKCIEGINQSVLMWFHWCPGMSLEEGPTQWQETEEQLNEEYREDD
jgi:hypothetical protein